MTNSGPRGLNACEQARALYDDGHTLADIARRLEVHATTVSRWKTAGGWPARKPSQPASRPSKTKPRHATTDAGQPPVPIGDEALDTLRLLTGVRQAVTYELATLREGATGEARARTLASLTRTLEVLRGVEAQVRTERAHPADHAEAHEPLVDIAELRRELARRLDRMRRAREPS